MPLAKVELRPLPRGAADVVKANGRLLQRLGFAARVRGDHHIFTKEGVEEILNLQPKGSQARPYQVRQVRRVILRYGLADEP